MRRNILFLPHRQAETLSSSMWPQGCRQHSLSRALSGLHVARKTNLAKANLVGMKPCVKRSSCGPCWGEGSEESFRLPGTSGSANTGRIRGPHTGVAAQAGSGQTCSGPMGVLAGKPWDLALHTEPKCRGASRHPGALPSSLPQARPFASFPAVCPFQLHDPLHRVIKRGGGGAETPP